MHKRNQRAYAQRGAAAVELAVVLGATVFLLMTMVLFSRAFYNFSVLKLASNDAAAYMATLPYVAIRGDDERGQAIQIAESIVNNAAAGAGITNASYVGEAMVHCDGGGCNGSIPANITVYVYFHINDLGFGDSRGWTDDDYRWTVDVNGSAPYAH